MNGTKESFHTLQDPNEKIQRSIIKIALWTLAIIVLLVAGGVFGHKTFRAWQERRLVAQANALVNEGDLKRASLDARRILQINPESAPGARIMARISEKAGSRSAIDWRRRAVDLTPGSATDLIALARAAIQFDDKANLDLALRKLPEGAKSTPEYLALAAELAMARNNAVEAEQHLSEAVRLDPSNKENVARLATLQLGSSDPAIRAQAKQALVQLQSEPMMRRDATRRLLVHSLRTKALEEAVTLARQLDSFPEKTFEDRLLLLSALNETADPGFSSLLQELKNSAAERPDSIAELLTWLNGNRMPAAAVAWASQLPPESATHGDVLIALSDSYIALRDWAGMQRMVKSGDWGGLDFLRNALAARASRELGDQTEAAVQWSEALQKVSANPKLALRLAEVVQKWAWRNEAIELLWVAAKDPANGDAALQALYNYFAKNGETSDLYRVLLHRQQFRPDDRNVQNNLAQLSLLLNLNADRGQSIARDLYEKEPANPAFASTYAFALYTAGDTKKALKVMSGLTPEQLHQPEIAAYYGVVLAAAGEQARAAEFLDLGEKAGLLPEERALVEKARRTLARR
ncbi:MAG: tetratricopeptide repeat protein [Chthoniobacterales bacterium]